MDNLENGTSTVEESIEETSTVVEKEDPNAFISYVTGMDPTSVDFADRMIERRNLFRELYNMPDDMAVFNGEKTNAQYCEELEARAKEESIIVSFDFEDFAKKNNLPEYCTGVFSEDIDGKVHLKSDFDKNDATKIRIFEHELVHALQYKYLPDMPIAQREFEAYLIANSSRSMFNYPVLKDLFFGLMHSSIKYVYDVNNKKVPWK